MRVSSNTSMSKSSPHLNNPHSQEQRGSAITIALAFMVFAVPIVVAGLSLASTLLLDSRNKLDALHGQYSLLGANSHAVHALIDSDGPATTTVTTVILNGSVVTTTIEMNETPPGSINAPPPSEAGREFRTDKAVAPTTATPGVDTVFTYVITVTNTDDESQTLTGIYDNLPSGFSYDNGSSSGVTTADPSKSGGEIRWTGLSLAVPAGGVVTQTFTATGKRPEGVYCNEAWVTPGGYEYTTSGLTADVTFGSPSSLECAGKSVKLTKSVSPSVVAAGTANTFHYVISIRNKSSSTLVAGSIEDLLPAGFTYANGSSQGTFFTNPVQTTESGRTRLTWTGSFNIPAGGTVTQEFDTTATPGAGDHWNESWADFSGLGYTAYTWPTARVEALTTALSTTTDGSHTYRCVIWVRTGRAIVNACEMD